MRKNITIFGAGSFGTAMTSVPFDNGHKVKLYMRSLSQLEEIKKTRKNERYLKKFTISEDIDLTNDIEYATKDCEVAIVSVPTQNIRGFLTEVKPFLKKDTIVVNLAKGIEVGTNYRISEIYDEVIGGDGYCVLSGPSHAEEVAEKMPTTVVVSSKNKSIAKKIQDTLSNEYFRVYTNHDLIGVEMGGALKNIIALGVGIINGLGMGDNPKAALITRGIHEISRLGVKMGASASTFSGLSGIGDLVVTCTSMHSRNMRFGKLLGKGYKMQDALKEIGMVVEGVTTCKAAYEISKKLTVSMPITQEIYNFLYNKVDLKDCISNLMNRGTKPEMIEEEKNIDII